MGGELVSLSPTQTNSDKEGEVTNTSPFLYTNIFETYAPMLMSMGMTYEEYWYGDNEAPKYYMRANRFRKQQENERLWLQGMYVYDAMCRVSPLFNALKPSDPMAYPSEPYPFDEQSLEEYNNNKKEQQYEENMAKFKNFAEMFNSQRGE